MKKCVWICFFLFVLAGCTEKHDFETLNDSYSEPPGVRAGEIILHFPNEALQPVLSMDGNSQFYICDGYELCLQIMEGGDLDKTVLEVTGRTKDSVTLIETALHEMVRYDCVWAAAGENAALTCRAAIVDDGKYHYAVSVMADSANAGKLQEDWNKIFASIEIRDIAA